MIEIGVCFIFANELKKRLIELYKIAGGSSSYTADEYHTYMHRSLAVLNVVTA